MPAKKKAAAKNKHTNGAAAHAKPSKPETESTQAAETSEAGQDAAAADSPAPRDILIADLARAYPAWAYLEDVVARMKREHGADENEVRDLLQELEDSLDVESKIEGTSDKVRLTEACWLIEVEKVHPRVLEAAKNGFIREAAPKVLGCTYDMAEKAIENLLGDQDIHMAGDVVKAGPEPEESDEEVEEKPKLTDGVEAATAAAGRPTRYLMCTLTRAEIDALRGEREAEDVQIEGLEAQLETLKVEAKELKDRIEELRAAGFERSKRVRAGGEHRYVPCEERRELDRREGAKPNHMIVVTYRLDTMEAIEFRELKDSERQGLLWEHAPAATPANGAVEVREASATA